MDLVAVFGNNDGEILGLSKVSEDNIFQPPHQSQAPAKPPHECLAEVSVGIYQARQHG